MNTYQLKDGKIIDGTCTTATDGALTFWFEQQGTKGYYVSYAISDFVHSVVRLNIGLNVGTETPARHQEQLDKTFGVVGHITNMLSNNGLLYKEYRILQGVYNGFTEHTLAAKFIVNSHSLCYISRLIGALQSTCSTLDQECIAVEITDASTRAAALVSANKVDSQSFDYKLFKQF